MNRQWTRAVLVLGLLPAAAKGGEAWQPVYADASISVSIDTASLSREGAAVSFREREILLQPRMDTASMRIIQEIRYRRSADCMARRLGALSRAEFSEKGTLVFYEAIKPSAASLETPQSGRELKVLEAACGPL